MESETFSILKGLYPSCRSNPKGIFENIPCPTCTTAKDRAKKKRFVFAGSLKSGCWICETQLTWEELTGQHTMPQRSFIAHSDEPARPPHPYKVNIPCNGDGVPVNKLCYDHPACKFLHKDHLYNLNRIYNDYGAIYVPLEQGVVVNGKPMVTSGERLIFPVVMRGELIGWQMRSIPGTKMGDRDGVIKYYHLFDKGSALYNYDNAKKFKIVIVTEGVKKCWKFPNAVATLGKGISDQQLQLLQEWACIVFLYDGEDVTQAKANKIVQQLCIGGYRAINIDPRKYGFPSPDEMPEEEANNIVMKEWNEKYGDYDI